MGISRVRIWSKPVRGQLGMHTRLLEKGNTQANPGTAR